jgi:hypothetical protein
LRRRHSPRTLRKLAREGARFTAQHLRALSPLRRRATLAATVLDTITPLTDDTVVLFDRALGRILRRAEIREQDVLIRDSGNRGGELLKLPVIAGAVKKPANKRSGKSPVS